MRIARLTFHDHGGPVISSGRGSVCVFGGPGPGQEFVDAGDRVVGDVVQEVLEIGEGLDPVQPAGDDHGIEERGALAAGVGADKE